MNKETLGGIGFIATLVLLFLACGILEAVL